MNLDTLASYAEIIGLITILGAAVYSWFQIGNHLLVNRLGTLRMHGYSEGLARVLMTIRFNTTISHGIL